ncbi:DUF5615 family PIN-like protein [Leptolyngbya subtilissima DQ-A4]|uniref:DUF5615 family PIN-like protein n=1 Tax=Leptolyngbya subtilissima DQ-A4 TaxID=2933933 RepID=A0ABV0KC38_9CYAN
MRDAGVNAVHVGEIGMAEADDADIILMAKLEDRVIATLDADFHTLLALSEALSPSVIRIRIERLRAQALTDLLPMTIAECSGELERGAAITVEPGRIRTRRLPLVPKI